MKGQSNCPAMGPRCKPSKINVDTDQKWYKPIISVETDMSGNRHVDKAFKCSQGVLGKYFRFLASHEFRMLRKVEHLDFTPHQVGRRSGASITIHYQLIEGRPIKEVAEGSGVPENFFSNLFSNVKALHQKGVVHMDLGNSGNILVAEDGAPAIIDFGSAIPLNWLPSVLRGWACRQDVLGVLKLWHRFDSVTMPLVLLQYYKRNYRKNIYTPKRFLKAIRRWITGGNDSEDLSGILAILFVFFGLLVLVSFT